MRLRKKNAPLYLKINAFRAADLFVPQEADRQAQVNAALVAQLNGHKKRCKRKPNSVHPSWDETLSLPLHMGDCSDLLILSVWNRSSSSKTYMGEVRLHVSDLFKDKSSYTTDSSWYKLFSAETRREFVTGSLLLSFELVGGKSKETERTVELSSPRPPMRNGSPGATLASDSNIPKLQVEPPTFADLSLHNSSLSEGSLGVVFQNWLDSLLYPEADVAASVDEQGFYTELLPSCQGSGISDISDLESTTGYKMAPSIATKGSSTGSNKSGVSDLAHEESTQNFLPVFVQDSTQSGYTSDSDISSAVSLSANTEVGLYNNEFGSNKEKKLSRLSRKRKSLPSYELRNRKVQGVLFLEIVSCSDLPPFKSFTRTSFDMDPFVVVAFGKKTFRTSWKRHKLNPIYNERLAFEVMDNEMNFNVQFSVLDKDHFSFHDQVAEYSLPVKTLIDYASDVTADDLVLEDENAVTVDFTDNSENSAVGTDNQSRSNMSSQIDLSTMKPTIELAQDSNLVKTRKKKFLRKRTTVSYVDTSLFKTLNLSLKLKDKKMGAKHSSSLKIRARYLTYENLRRDFWKVLLEQYNVDESSNSMDYIELISFLDTLGCSNSDDIVGDFFKSLEKSTWGGDKITHEEIVDCLENYLLSGDAETGKKIFEIDKCPICMQTRLKKKDDLDIITHVAICASKDWSIVNKLLVSSFVTPQIASRRWFTKVLIKLTYGNYKLGGNSANILVQDRSTGLVMEEKMSITVRLGIRLLYKGLDKAKSKRIRILLQKLSVKQGKKFDQPSSTSDIRSFIQFHKLDLSDCLISDPMKFSSFNDFFYRKLKPGARPVEAKEDNRVAVSPADCRCTTFVSVNDATELWIKGRNFSLAKLFNGNFNSLEKSDLYKPEKCCIGIFRLAPQDYHRFHSPVAGIIGHSKYIEGEYYTVNPMAIRSALDVYGENVRVIVPIETEEFGTVVLIAIGAMMVGSTIITVTEGQEVKKGDEIGYFKFGGSTVLLLFQKEFFAFDSDLVNNSKQCVETLVRVGQSIGHTPNVSEFERTRIDFDKQPKDFRLNLIRAITGGDVDKSLKLESWESKHLNISEDDVDFLAKEDAEEFGESNENDSDWKST